MGLMCICYSEGRMPFLSADSPKEWVGSQKLLTRVMGENRAGQWEIWYVLIHWVQGEYTWLHHTHLTVNGFQWDSCPHPKFPSIRKRTIHQTINLRLIIPIWSQITLRSSAFYRLLLNGYLVGCARVGRGGMAKGDSNNVSGWRSGELEGPFHACISLLNVHENLVKIPILVMMSRGRSNNLHLHQAPRWCQSHRSMDLTLSCKVLESI